MPKPLKHAALYRRQAPTSVKPVGTAPRPAPASAPATDIDAVIASFMAKLGAAAGRTGGAARLEHEGDTERRNMALNAARARWGQRKVAKAGIKTR